jgi:hypothetical protein
VLLDDALSTGIFNDLLVTFCEDTKSKTLDSRLRGNDEAVEMTEFEDLAKEECSKKPYPRASTSTHPFRRNSFTTPT